MHAASAPLRRASCSSGACLGIAGLVAPLNQAVVRSDGMAVEYERVVRHSGEARLAIEVPAALQRDGVFSLWSDRSCWQSTELEADPLPQAESSAVSGDRVLDEFPSADPAVVERDGTISVIPKEPSSV